ncbi:MAG: HlyD family efflux transporter periplasmic adaptor subunit [Gemmatimonadaceae bacterium]
MTPRLQWILPLALALSCKGEAKPDAYGTFEANEVVVSAQTSGQLLSFSPVEGARLARGAVVATVDTGQLTLERNQLVAQREATGSRSAGISRQIEALQIQYTFAGRHYDRTRRLFAQQAATAQQLDQAEKEYRVLGAQIRAARAEVLSIGRDVSSGSARVAELGGRLDRSRIINPEPGTVLTTFVRAGEIVQPGQPLYRIANLDTLTLRAYISETQLHAVTLGERVTVHIDSGSGVTDLAGTVSWISAKAEFTPTPVQTRDERADLVYAVKILVPNTGGTLKIGMPADVTVPAGAPRS